MFNIYYINYAKAFEISMLIDNKMLEMITKTKEGSVELEGKGAVNLEKTKKIPLLNKAIPAIDISGEITGSKSKNVIDTIKVVSTKSTILEPIYKKAKEIKKLSENSIGNLIKIKNVSLIIDNIEDILATKTLLSGLLNSVAIDGFGEMNLTSVLEILFKDSSYILSGKLPQRFGGDEKIMLKIPMSAENEMENQYSISDLEIGKVTVIGIYRGNYKEKEIRDTNTILTNWNSIKMQKVKMKTIELQPFLNWEKEPSYTAPDWWQPYNKVKHERLLNYREANLKNVVNALAGLYVLENYFVKFIGDRDHEIDVPNDVSKLFEMIDYETKNTVIGKDSYLATTEAIDKMFQ